jgi:hypothetical protein
MRFHHGIRRVQRFLTTSNTVTKIAGEKTTDEKAAEVCNH